MIEMNSYRLLIGSIYIQYVSLGGGGGATAPRASPLYLPLREGYGINIP